MMRGKGSQDDQSMNMAESFYAAAHEKTVRVQIRKGKNLQFFIVMRGNLTWFIDNARKKLMQISDVLIYIL